MLKVLCLLVMGFRCMVASCENSKRASKVSPDVSLHSFPRDGELRAKWTKSLGLGDTVIRPSHMVCSLHFQVDDYIRYSSDSKKRRVNALKRPKLRSDAVPSIWNIQEDSPITAQIPEPLEDVETKEEVCFDDIEGHLIANGIHYFKRVGGICIPGLGWSDGEPPSLKYSIVIGSSLLLTSYSHGECCMVITENFKLSISKSMKLKRPGFSPSAHDRSFMKSSVFAAVEELERGLLEYDKQILNYVAGSAARSEIKLHKCYCCRLHLATEEFQGDGTFTEQINRGGLTMPSENAKRLGQIALACFQAIHKDKELLKKFITHRFQRILFCLVVNLDFCYVSEPISINSECSRGHKYVNGFIQRIYNLLCKSNAKSAEPRDKSSVPAKIRKLNGV